MALHSWGITTRSSKLCRGNHTRLKYAAWLWTVGPRNGAGRRTLPPKMAHSGCGHQVPNSAWHLQRDAKPQRPCMQTTDLRPQRWCAAGPKVSAGWCTNTKLYFEAWHFLSCMLPRNPLVDLQGPCGLLFSHPSTFKGIGLTIAAHTDPLSRHCFQT